MIVLKSMEIDVLSAHQRGDFENWLEDLDFEPSIQVLPENYTPVFAIAFFLHIAGPQVGGNNSARSERMTCSYVSLLALIFEYFHIIESEIYVLPHL